MADEIITELWRVKDAIAKEYGCDVKSLAAYLKTKNRRGKRPTVNLRAIKQAEPKKAADG